VRSGSEDDIRRESEFLFRCYSDPFYEEGRELTETETRRAAILIDISERHAFRIGRRAPRSDASTLSPSDSRRFSAEIAATAAEFGRHYLAIVEKEPEVIGFGEPEPRP
jgi:hypothetical protein